MMNKAIQSMLLATSLIWCAATVAPNAVAADAAVSKPAADGRYAMAKYGELYIGPKTMTVELAPTVAGDLTLVKVYGINHAWDGKVFLAKVNKLNNGRINYVTQVDGADYNIMISLGDGRTNFYLPMADGEMRLSFARERAYDVKTEHVMTDYENQRKKK